MNSSSLLDEQPSQTSHFAAPPVENKEETLEVVKVEVPAQHSTAGLDKTLRRANKRRIWVTALMPVLPVGLLLGLKATMSAEAWMAMCTSAWFVWSAIALCIVTTLNLLRPNAKERKAANKLKEVDDLSAAGPLIETLYLGLDTPNNVAMTETLIRLLPRFRTSDAGVLSKRHLHLMQLILMSNAYFAGDLFENPVVKLKRHFRLQRAILQAFEQVGDATVWAGVQYVATGSPNLEVRAAAKQCMPFVQERVKIAAQSKTLLRASQSDAGANILVRPAVSSDTPEQELVRAGSVPGDVSSTPLT